MNSPGISKFKYKVKIYWELSHAKFFLRIQEHVE
jgi:hypothetical protein